MTDPSKPLVIAGHSVALGEHKTFNLHIARLYDYTEISMPICVIRAKEPGPTIFISGAVHGDEIIGPEIIKRLLRSKRMRLQKGSVIAIPIVNVFGYNNGSRYLPDRRDLNRCFPGTQNGSLAARIAYTFTNEIIKKSNYGIDLHSGSIHRSNFPQVRASLADAETERLAYAFGAPVILQAKLRDGSLRASAEEHKVPMLLFEGGEALRFDESVIKLGLRGVFNVMSSIGLIAPDHDVFDPKETAKSFLAHSSYWLRAPQSGSLRALKKLGAKVEKNSKLAVISDVFGENPQTILAKTSGIIIGENRLPLVNKGDAVFHIATFEDNKDIQTLNDDYLGYFDYPMV